MKDLKIYYWDEGTINSKFDKEIEKLAKKFGLSFQSSDFEIGKGIRDIHYRKKNNQGDKNAG